jgi:hypothetical protein
MVFEEPQKLWRSPPFLVRLIYLALDVNKLKLIKPMVSHMVSLSLLLSCKGKSRSLKPCDAIWVKPNEAFFKLNVKAVYHTTISTNVEVLLHVFLET